MLSIEDFLPSAEEVCWGSQRAEMGRWDCVWCGSRDVARNGGYMHHYPKYTCRGFGRFFNDKIGPIFEYSKMGVRESLYIARELKRNKSIYVHVMSLQG